MRDNLKQINISRFIEHTNNTERQKGARNMSQHKNKSQNSDSKNIKPSDIKGKLEVPDKRERKDGPGGN